MSERRVCDVTGSSSGTTTFVPLPGLDGLQVADFHRIHDLNVTGAFQATRALGPQVRVSAVAPGLVETPWLQQGLGAGACHAHLARHQAADAAADHTQLVAREIRRRHDAHQAAIVQIAGSTRWRQRRKACRDRIWPGCQWLRGIGPPHNGPRPYRRGGTQSAAIVTSLRGWPMSQPRRQQYPAFAQPFAGRAPRHPGELT